MPPKKRKGTAKKASRFSLFRTLTLAGIILVTGLTLFLILRLPQKPDISKRPEADSQPVSRPEPAPADARQPQKESPTKDTQPPTASGTPVPTGQPLPYEAIVDDFEARVRDVDLAILHTLGSLQENESVMRHRALEARQFKGQEFYYQNITLNLRQDVFPFLAELERNLKSMAPDASMQTLNDNPRDLEISILGQPTHHIFLPLPSTPAPPDKIAKTPRLVLIIDDLGESTKTARRLARLPFPVTFSVLPFNTKAREVADIARQNDLELLMHLPCEPEGYPKPNSGPGTLRVDMSAAELEQTLVANLARLPEVDGVNNHMGSSLTQNTKAMHVVLAHLKGSGKFFVDSLTTPKSCIASVSSSLGMRYYRRHIFLDNTAKERAILLQLKKVESLAKKNGFAIAIGHPYPATLAALEVWARKRDMQITVCKIQDI